MLSLAIVSLSPCSAAISSRTGATILHGPHHSAQKSTSTGLSLSSTSSAKLASVTVLVLPAMVVLLVVCVARCGPGRDNPADPWSMPWPRGRGPSSALVERLGQEALRVDGRSRTRAG